MPAYNPGDIVTLKSGGPLMVVVGEELHKDVFPEPITAVVCQFSAKSRVHGVHCPVTSLRKISGAHEDYTPKVGDLVRHKSGGPVMLVRELLPRSTVMCEWHNPVSGEFHEGAFPNSTLLLA